MGFRNDRQRAAACRALLAPSGLDRYWHGADETRFGPTLEAACQLRRIHEGSCPLSHSEQIMLRVAFDVWNGAGGVSMWEMMTYLDPVDVVAIGNLLMYAGAEDSRCIDNWIDEWTGNNKDAGAL